MVIEVRTARSGMTVGNAGVLVVGFGFGGVDLIAVK